MNSSFNSDLTGVGTDMSCIGHPYPLTVKPQKDKISAFFENHATTRKIVAYVPPVLIGGAALVDQFSSYKVLPGFGVCSIVAFVAIAFFSLLAQSCERSLHEKRIERLQ